MVGACGGVGASTLAACLAATLRGPTTLVDLAPAAGGLDVTLGVETVPGARWPDLADGLPDLAVPAAGASDPGARRPRWREVRVLSADRAGTGPTPGTVTAVWSALRAGGGRIVVDLAPSGLAGPVAGVLDDLTARAQVVLLTSQDVRGVAGALAARDLLGGAPDHLVLRRGRRARVAPAEVEAALGCPVAATLPTARDVADAMDAGLGPVWRRRSRLGRAITGLGRRLDG